MIHKIIILLFVIFSMVTLNGCVAPSEVYDYSEFNKSKPASILVVMPLNESNEINAGFSVLSKITYPLAEAGYYVFPIVVADEVFKQNGLTFANDIHEVNIARLHKIFNNDAVLYISIKGYGTSFQLFQSDTRVILIAKLVDTRSGKLLWVGGSTASSLEQKGNNRVGSGSLFASLIIAAVDQINETVTDKSDEIAGIAVRRLLQPTPLRHNGILHGPRFIEQLK